MTIIFYALRFTFYALRFTPYATHVITSFSTPARVRGVAPGHGHPGAPFDAESQQTTR
jgi:hypothetical protein